MSEGAAKRLEAKVELLRGEAITAWDRSQAAVERFAGAADLNMNMEIRVMELEGLLSSERGRADEAEKTHSQSTAEASQQGNFSPGDVVQDGGQKSHFVCAYRWTSIEVSHRVGKISK